MSTATHVDLIPGISKSVARRLKAAGIHLSTDLLRVDLSRLERKLAGAATIDDVHRWRATASLFEIDGMSLAWAAALAKRGVTLGSELCLSKHSAVRKLFAAALTAHEITEVPSDDVLAAMLVDSMCLKSTGVLNVTVVGKASRPLRGAKVTYGRREDQTDARGRTRFVRLPLNASFDLHVRKSGYADAQRASVRPSAPQLLVGERVLLAKGTHRARASHRRLSQFDGQSVGELNGRHFHLETSKSRKLRHGDRLRWVATLANGEVKLSSRFLESDGKRLIVRAWHLPRTMLPAGAALRDDFRVTRAGLVPEKLSTRRLARLRMLRTILRELPKPKNVNEFHRSAKDALRRLKRQAEFTRVV